MGIGGLMKPADKETKAGESSQAGSQAAAQPRVAPVRRPSAINWARFSHTGNAEQRKKSGNTEADQNINEDDDRGIRFTISGAGERMTKDAFLKEVQKLERSNREVPGNLVASKDVKGTAKAPPGTEASEQTGVPDLVNPAIDVTQASDSARGENKSPARPVTTTRGRSSAKVTEDAPSTDTPETAAERRRRLAAFASVREDDNPETPAERRRREAALGVAGPSSEESDSDDDDTPRVLRERRGIRFAEGPAKRA
jgi:hypothetical protein